MSKKNSQKGFKQLINKLMIKNSIESILNQNKL